MKRENNTNEGIIREFNNGNINIKLSVDTIADINAGKYSDIEVLSWLLNDLDCYFISDQFCLSNFDMGVSIYNCYSDLVYILAFSDIINKLMQNKTLKLYAATPTADDRSLIDEI